MLLANTNSSKPVFSIVLLPISASFTSRLIFYVGKFQVLFSLSFCLSLWLCFSFFWCAAWACCWSLGEYSRTATSSAEADKISVLPHCAAGGGRGLHFTLPILYIIVIVSCSSLGSIWHMVTCRRLAEIKAKKPQKKKALGNVRNYLFLYLQTVSLPFLFFFKSIQ